MVQTSPWNIMVAPISVKAEIESNFLFNPGTYNTLISLIGTSLSSLLNILTGTSPFPTDAISLLSAKVTDPGLWSTSRMKSSFSPVIWTVAPESNHHSELTESFSSPACNASSGSNEHVSMRALRVFKCLSRKGTG